MSLDTTIYLSDWLYILKGAGITIFLCLNAMVFGALLGVVLGLLRTNRYRPIVYLVGLYIYIIRGTPLLMQLFLVYYGLPVLLGFNVPAFTTALVGLSIYTSAYVAEIVKAGLNAVGKGQRDAAKALGMNAWQEFSHIVFPQALKVIIPPSFGFFIALIKDSSLVSIIGFIELTRSSRFVIARTYQPFTIYLGVAAIYFIICYGLSLISRRYIEGRDKSECR
jgi:polar amino acid transport system permease protein